MSRRSLSDSEKLQEHVDAQAELLHCLNEACGWTGPRAAADEDDRCPNCSGEALADDSDPGARCTCRDCNPHRALAQQLINDMNHDFNHQIGTLEQTMSLSTPTFAADTWCQVPHCINNALPGEKHCLRCSIKAAGPHAIEKWYTGKALATIRDYVLPTLAQAEKEGFWPKGASRKIVAALGKQSIAERFARAQERDRNEQGINLSGRLDDVMDNRERWWESKLRGHAFISAMRFGSFTEAPELVELGAQLEPLCLNDTERDALKMARKWAADFAPIAELVKHLDSLRPPPVIVMGSLSRTIASNLGKNLGIRFDTIETPPMKREWIEMVIKGKKVKIAVYTIDWPAGTQHDRSRFAHGSHAGNDQCHACGHAIRNAFNWVPLMADGPDGKLSLWVGRDCAHKLFNVDVKGDGQFLRRGVP